MKGDFMNLKEKYDALVDVACENGKTIESGGNFNEDSETGHDVRLVKHGGLWLVVERIDDEGNIDDFIDREDAREAFAAIKAEIGEELGECDKDEE
jgi:hypothetical protein